MIEEEITEHYNLTTGLIEIRCGHCGNAEDIPARPREKHEYGPFLPPWTAARKPLRFTYWPRGNCLLRGVVSWNDLVCSKCGNMNIEDD